MKKLFKFWNEETHRSASIVQTEEQGFGILVQQTYIADSQWWIEHISKWLKVGTKTRHIPSCERTSHNQFKSINMVQIEFSKRQNKGNVNQISRARLAHSSRWCGVKETEIYLNNLWIQAIQCCLSHSQQVVTRSLLSHTPFTVMCSIARNILLRYRKNCSITI